MRRVRLMLVGAGNPSIRPITNLHLFLANSNSTAACCAAYASASAPSITSFLPTSIFAQQSTPTRKEDTLYTYEAPTAGPMPFIYCGSAH